MLDEETDSEYVNEGKSFSTFPADGFTGIKKAEYYYNDRMNSTIQGLHYIV